MNAVAACRLCGAGNLLTVLDLGDQALTGVFPASADEPVTTGPLRLVWCRACTLLQLAHTYEPSEMYGADYGYRSGLNASMVQHLARKANALERLVRVRSGEVVLDIGSNDGTLLTSYQTAGVRRIGIDPTARRFAALYPDDANVVPEFFSADRYYEVAEEPARIITSIAMFYDLEDPESFATDVAACLAKDGVWHFEQSYMPSMLRTTGYDTICHEHVEYYSLATVQRILNEAGLAIIDVRFNRVNGGSFAITASHANSALPKENVLVEWLLAQEERLALHTPRPFREFEGRVFQHRADLTGLVRRLRESGATIMGYGASTKGNVLLQFCGFGPEDIIAIGEVNQDKFGRVTPGTGIPIVPESEVTTSRSDYLLVFPWHFREGIIQRESEYLQGGGKLIFPLPEIEIVGS